MSGVFGHGVGDCGGLDRRVAGARAGIACLPSCHRCRCLPAFAQAVWRFEKSRRRICDARFIKYTSLARFANVPSNYGTNPGPDPRPAPICGSAIMRARCRLAPLPTPLQHLGGRRFFVLSPIRNLSPRVAVQAGDLVGVCRGDTRSGEEVWIRACSGRGFAVR